MYDKYLFIANINSETNTDILYELFSQVGTVDDVWINKENHTAVIQYESECGVLSAMLLLNDIKLHGNQLCLSMVHNHNKLHDIHKRYLELIEELQVTPSILECSVSLDQYDAQKHGYNYKNNFSVPPHPIIIGHYSNEAVIPPNHRVESNNFAYYNGYVNNLCSEAYDYNLRYNQYENYSGHNQHFPNYEQNYGSNYDQNKHNADYNQSRHPYNHNQFEKHDHTHRLNYELHHAQQHSTPKYQPEYYHHDTRHDKQYREYEYYKSSRNGHYDYKERSVAKYDSNYKRQSVGYDLNCKRVCNNEYSNIY